MLLSALLLLVLVLLPNALVEWWKEISLGYAITQNNILGPAHSFHWFLVERQWPDFHWKSHLALT